MHPSREYVVPVTVAVVVALVCTITLFFMDFGPGNDVQGKGANMITTAIVERAGATMTPTELSPQPAKPDISPASAPSTH